MLSPLRITYVVYSNDQSFIGGKLEWAQKQEVPYGLPHLQGQYVRFLAAGLEGAHKSSELKLERRALVQSLDLQNDTSEVHLVVGSRPWNCGI